ncbi:MAG: HEAT repeat domain-containing protein [Methylotenera sp.]|nr:HEAT repeat domain-containing protein [Oligoflexia bacterium]
MKDFAPKKEENLLLISLDPSGVITDVRVAAQPLTEQGTRLKVNSIVPLFKRLPLLKPGKLSRIEGDERGIPYSIQYTGTDVGNNQLKITGLVSDVQQLGNTPSKAAAAGAPNLALVGLESSQEQSFDWRWDTAMKLPISQNFGAIAGTRQFGQDVSNSHIQFEAIWAPSVAARFTPADAERFKYSVDFKKFLSASGSRMKEMEQMTKKQLLGKTPGQILGQVGNLKNSKLTDLQKDELFIDLGKALKSDPSLIDNAKQLALTGEPDSRQNSMALGALGFEGSAQSQAAMIEVYLNPRATADEKQKVLTELAICPEPLSKETKTFLKAKYKEADPMVSDFASTAGLALGSSIARDGDPETVKLLQSEWEKTSGFFTARQDQDKQVYLLSAMGNSKSNVFQDQVKTAARSSHDEVRAAAVHSVRFAQDDYSRNLIRTSIKSDSSTDVKLSAAQALRYQPFDEATRQLLIDCSQDSHIGVKIQCYRVLTSRLEQPGIRQLLSSRLNSESDDQVRGLLQAALDTKE